MPIPETIAVAPGLQWKWTLSGAESVSAVTSSSLAVSQTPPGRPEPGPDTGGEVNFGDDLAWGIGGPIVIGIGVILVIVWMARRGRTSWEKQQEQK